MVNKLILFIICTLLSASSLADKQPIYTIGVENIDYYPHYAFGHRKNSFTKELLEFFFKQEAINIKFIPLPLKRFNQWYTKDKIDFKYPDNGEWRTDDANKFNVIYSDTVFTYIAGTIVLNKTTEFTAKNIKRLGTITGFYPTLWINRINNNETKLIEDNNVISVMRLLIHGIVDGINLDYSVVNFHLKQIDKKKLLIMAKSLPHKKTNFHLSTVKHPDIIKKFNLFLKQNQLLINKLKVKHGIIDDPFNLKSL